MRIDLLQGAGILKSGLPMRIRCLTHDWARGASVRLGVLALLLKVAGCGICGGQTGDCGSSDSAGVQRDGGDATGATGGSAGAAGHGSIDSTGPAACGEYLPLGYDDPSEEGFTGREVVDAHSGTYVGTVAVSNDAFWEAIGSEPAADPLSVSLTIAASLTMADGEAAVREPACSGQLEVRVDVELTLGDEVFTALGADWLVGDVERAWLEVTLSASGNTPAGAHRLTMFLPPSAAGSTLYVEAADGVSVPVSLELARE